MNLLWHKTGKHPLPGSEDILACGDGRALAPPDQVKVGRAILFMAEKDQINGNAPVPHSSRPDASRFFH
jgi:hypothetical protein